MKPYKYMALGLLLAPLAACSTTQSSTYDPGVNGVRNMWAGNHMSKMMIKNAVIAQKTLYPYHFESDSAELNALGQTDFDVLVDHFAENTGVLNVRRGGIAEALYEARVAGLREALVASGLAESQVTIADGKPGGDGMSSGRILVILADRSSSDNLIAPPRLTGGQAQ